eukprot:640666_1
MVLFWMVIGLFITIRANEMQIGAARDISEQSDADKWNEIQQYVVLMHNDLRKTLYRNASMDEMCSYPLIQAKQQIVNGVNYWVKLNACDGRYVHVYFYVPIGGTPEINAMEFPKEEFDALNLFRTDDIKPFKY